MFHMQERQLSLSWLFKKLVHNAVRHFSCFRSNDIFLISCIMGTPPVIWSCDWPFLYLRSFNSIQ